MSSNSIQNCDRRSDDRHTHTHTHTQTDASDLIICPMLCYSNETDNNTIANVYSTVIMARLMREFIRFFRWMQTKHQAAANPQTKSTDLGKSWAVSLPVGCHHLHPLSPFIITQSEGWYSFYRPVEGRRLSRPTLCPQKTCYYIFYNNFNNRCPITIIFGISSSKSMRHRKMVSFPTSPI